MLGKLLPRLTFILLTVLFSVYAYTISFDRQPDYHILGLYMLSTLLVSCGLVYWEWRYQKDLARDLVATIVGAAAGLFVAGLLLFIAWLFVVSYNLLQGDASGSLTQALTTSFWQIQFWLPLVVACCLYMGITVVMQTRNDFRFLVPYIDFSERSTREGGMLLDTSAIIDGRIAELIEGKIVGCPVIIPDFVLRELQTLADGKDKLKRERGRRGLDIAARLQNISDGDVSVRQSVLSTDQQKMPVDQMLLFEARELNCRIVTTDFNLNKLSQVEGIVVVNLNDLSNALKPQVIPGEKLMLRIIKKGQEAGQGVGYLQDGTMVVVEGGDKLISENESCIYITGSIQTSAGRMVFARPDAEEGSSNESK